MQNINFQKYEPTGDIVATWALTEVKQQLGLSIIKLQRSKDGEGWRVIFEKPDGTSTCLPCSKEMTAGQFPDARLAQTKDGKYLIVRPEGSSTVISI